MVRDKSTEIYSLRCTPIKGETYPSYCSRLREISSLFARKPSLYILHTYIYNDCKSVSFSVVVVMNVEAFVSVSSEIGPTFRALFSIFGTEIDYTTCRTSWLEKANECDNHLVYINVAFVTANVLAWFQYGHVRFVAAY
jgi:hypothetical protein